LESLIPEKPFKDHMFTWEARTVAEYRCAPRKRLRVLSQLVVLLSGSADWIQRHIPPEISEKRDVDIGWPSRTAMRAKELRGPYSHLSVCLCCFFPALAENEELNSVNYLRKVTMTIQC
jgi:hypothetical protein